MREAELITKIKDYLKTIPRLLLLEGTRRTVRYSRDTRHDRLL